MQRLEELIQDHPDTANAIGAPGRDWMTYGDLKVLTLNVRQALRAAGIGAQDRVAIVLPNGPEMAAAFVTVAQSATTAPLNLAYKEDEFAFYLEDLKAKAIIVETGYDGPARRVAKRFDMIVIELTASNPAGSFTLSTTATGSAADTVPAPDDVALILHTSGTTSRPKIVPLLQSNVAASAVNVRESLALTRDDCCLNVMPLFHIHGLIAAVSGSLAAGASISCAPGFDALKFYGWLEEVDPKLVHSSSNDASGHFSACAAECCDYRERALALLAFVFILIAGPSDDRIGRNLWCASG